VSDRSDIQRERARSLRLAGAREDSNGGDAKPPEAEVEDSVEIEIEEIPIEIEEVPIELEEVPPAAEEAAIQVEEVAVVAEETGAVEIEIEETPPPEAPPPRRGPPPRPRRRSAFEPAGFLTALGTGLSRGLDLPTALEVAAKVLPEPARHTSERVAARLRGEYAQDEWGYDEEFVEIVYPLLEFMYENWWRVKATGLNNVPGHDRAMLVANHAGVVPWDATMMAVAIQKLHPLPRQPRFMVLDWAFRLPWVSGFMRRVGGVVASPYNAMRLLHQGHLVMVFPEGAKGAGKPFAERYRLQRFGRGGFVEIALRTGAPIVPVAVVGSEEIYPKLGESRLLARLTGAPYVPLTPTFPWLGVAGAVPLPSKWRIEFCEPLDLSGYGPEAADDRTVVFELSERVRETIQAAVYDNLLARGSAFL